MTYSVSWGPCACGSLNIYCKDGVGHCPGCGAERPPMVSPCQNPVEVVKDPPEGSSLGINMIGTRPCGGRINIKTGQCEFCDVTTIEEARS